jgi:hypothetical protein
MGQHRHVIQRIYQPPVKNSQSAFCQNPHDALQTQGSGIVMSSLWDGSGNATIDLVTAEERIQTYSANKAVDERRRNLDF